MQQTRIAVDVHSGDYGHDVVIEGVLQALKREAAPIKVLLCGEQGTVRSVIERAGGAHYIHDGVIQIIESRESNVSGLIPTTLWRQKRDFSIIRCIALQKEGLADVSMSAGDIRILIGASIFILGRQKGVKRPALAAFLPTTSSRPTLILDVGANIECRIEHLVAFGMMGYSFVKESFSLENPTVSLLNVGKESSKGTRTIIEAGKILAARCRGYRGFIEGCDVLKGESDVVVCDGFSGNVLLKVCESFHTLIKSVIGDSKKGLFDALESNLAILNAENYGAVPLLGLQGVVFKAHGSSSPKAIAQAVLTASRIMSRR